MPYDFPQFQDAVSLDASRSWTAAFDSYDQRNEDAYYWVSLREEGRETSRFMARIGLEWAGDDWTRPEFVERLRHELHAVALQGKANTEYRGSMA